MRAGAAPAIDYQKLTFGYVRSADQQSPRPAHHKVIVVGAGPVGLTAAIDLAQHGINVVLLDDDDRLSSGSRAICFAKRTLDIWDRLGCGQRMVEKGVTWNTGKVFFRDDAVYEFDLQPEAGHQRPAFVNLQQYYVEGFLLDRARALPQLDLRWKNRVTGLAQSEDGVCVTIATPDGEYTLYADWLVAADGARSPIRTAMGLHSTGRSFHDRFLIADIRMAAPFPAERWFWFDPPFHPNQSVLLHQQPDGIWRIDFQLGWDADPVAERAPERVIPRVRALLGNDAQFALEWASVYSFSCLRMEKFRHGRVLFAGDAAHGVSPFGARGANSGVQDADNLAWKLRLVVTGAAPEALLDSYDSERVAAADENIQNSTRSTDFITPKSDASRAFRDATLDLARECGFARRLVNSGRLSVASTYHDSPLNTPDIDNFAAALVPGAPAADAPVHVGGQPGWFLPQTSGGEFTGIFFGDGGTRPDADVPVRTVLVQPQGVPPDDSAAIHDSHGLLAQRYDAWPGSFYLLRPDQHVCARWRRFEPHLVRDAVARAMGRI
jgi:3-(3-hydroxy-phenyl)propionate hydroxylase